jgi:hypothetical protein
LIPDNWVIEPVILELNIGDSIVLNGCTVHATADNDSEKHVLRAFMVLCTNDAEKQIDLDSTYPVEGHYSNIFLNILQAHQSLSVLGLIDYMSK